jgi:hypothetical protein
LGRNVDDTVRKMRPNHRTGERNQVGLGELILARIREQRKWRVSASGLRNPNGMDWEPRTGALWTAVNERDELGSDLGAGLHDVGEGGRRPIASGALASRNPIAGIAACARDQHSDRPANQLGGQLWQSIELIFVSSARISTGTCRKLVMWKATT